MDARRSWTLIALSSALLVAAASSARSQAGGYPTRAVTVISDAGTGSSVDVATRVVADGLSKIWEQNVAVVNRPGANGSIAAHAASEATGDGYTLYAPVSSTFIALPTVAPNLPVKLPRDFLPVGFVAEQPMFIAVDPTSGITSVRQLIDRAKKEPGTIATAVSGIGRMTHLTTVMLQREADIKLVTVPYTGGPSAALADVAGGRVSMIIEGYSGIIGAVKAGQVKLIATAAPQRLAEFPDLPTVAETIPDFSASGWIMLAAPLGTPTRVIVKVNADLRKILTQPDIKQKLATTGNYTRAMTPDETEAFVVRQQARWLPVVQTITPQ